jgi:hypothetical protein
LADAEGDLLWVVWGGHGVIDAAGRRRLFLADASARDRLNLDLDDTLTFFRSTAVRSFARQIWIVDACQTLHDGARSRRGLPHEEFGRAPAVAGRHQAVLVAARPGERAANVAGQQTGLFSRELLRLLADTPDAQRWPPDMDAVMARLRTELATLRAAGQARQTPIYLWSRTWDGDEGQLLLGERRVAGVVQSEAPARASEVSRIVEALLAIPEFADPRGREEILSLIRGEADVWAVIPRHSSARLDAVSVVRTCVRFAGALHELTEAVRLCSGDGPQTARLEAAVATVAGPADL